VREVLNDVDGALLTLEVDPATDLDAHEAEAAGLVLRREVLQLRRPLPPGRASTLNFRTFRPGADNAEFLRVNNLAFAWHPDQSNLTSEQLGQRIEQPWFSAEGFLVHEHDARMLAFCWTKVHPAHGDEPELGEIYVIGVDPSAHGRGLGTEMVLAGLEHLSSLGISTGMLHVEADNLAALQMYDRLGFTRHSSHQWWARAETPASPAATVPGANP
jgi:mycothiol synthase